MFPAKRKTDIKIEVRNSTDEEIIDPFRRLSSLPRVLFAVNREKAIVQSRWMRDIRLEAGEQFEKQP